MGCRPEFLKLFWMENRCGLLVQKGHATYRSEQQLWPLDKTTPRNRPLGFSRVQLIMLWNALFIISGSCSRQSKCFGWPSAARTEDVSRTGGRSNRGCQTRTPAKRANEKRQEASVYIPIIQSRWPAQWSDGSGLLNRAEIKARRRQFPRRTAPCFDNNVLFRDCRTRLGNGRKESFKGL